MGGYDEKQSYSHSEYINPHKQLPPPFDFERLTRFMAYGFIMSPVQYHWFGFLARTFRITKQSTAVPALQRVCFDQLIFAPMGKTLCYHVRGETPILMRGRARLFLYIHDRNRRRRSESGGTQVPGRLPSCAKGKFHALAGCAVPQLLRHPTPVPDSQCPHPSMLWSLLTVKHSPSSRPLAFSGPHTYRLQTHQTNLWMYKAFWPLKAMTRLHDGVGYLGLHGCIGHQRRQIWVSIRDRCSCM